MESSIRNEAGVTTSDLLWGATFALITGIFIFLGERIWHDLVRLWHTPVTYGWWFVLGIPSMLLGIFRAARAFVSWQVERESKEQPRLLYCEKNGHCKDCQESGSSFCCICTREVFQ